MKIRIEIRSDSVVIDGYVNAVARDSRILYSPKGKFREQIVPQAFTRALGKAKNVDILLNHNKQRNLGSTTAGNLELFEDNIGLRAIATITDAEVMKKARNNELRGWSFGFFTDKDRWEDIDENIQRRYIEEMELTEVSIVDKTQIPAYSATSIETRSNQEQLIETRELENEIRTVITDDSYKEENKRYLEEIKSLKQSTNK